MNRFNPGGCCCQQCLILSDNYDRANGSLGAHWDVRAGAMAIVSVRAATSTPDSLAVTVDENPDATGDGVVSATVRVSGSNTEVRLIIDYVDDDNYHFAQLLITGGSFSVAKLYKRAAGSNTLLAQSATFFVGTNADYYVRLCLLDESLVFGFSSISPTSLEPKVFYHSTVQHGGTQAGIATGAVPSGTAQFDDFQFTKHHDVDQDDCEDCFFCTTCDEDSIPSLVKLVVTGIANKAGICGTACTNCTLLNGTFILYYDSGACSGGTACSWRSAPISGLCDLGGPFGECADEDTLAIYHWVVWMGSDKKLHAQLNNHPSVDVGGGNLRHYPYFAKQMTTDLCADWDTESLTPGEEYPFGCAAWCDYSAATAEVTAL